jgi:hypothetical protein
MKKFVLTITVTILLAVTTNVNYGKIWRVDRSPDNKPDFVSLQEAVNTIPAGDTLYVSGNQGSYGDIVLNKKVIIIGPGYLLNQNPNTQARKVSAKVAAFTFLSGSEFSQVSGMEIQWQMIVMASNIIVYKNYFSTNPTIGRGIISLQGDNLTSIVISQNYFDRAFSIGEIVLAVTGNHGNVIVKNNIFNCERSTAIYIETYGDCIIENNVINGNINFNNNSESEFKNNIVVDGSVNIGNNIAKNNVCNAGQLSATDNKTNIDMTTVFVWYSTTSPDGYYQLKDNSPAKGYGWNGVDCGAFGGADSYVLSGIPSIPTIYEADIPITGSNKDGLPVKIKAKTNK